MDREYEKWLDKMAERANEHKLGLYVGWGWCNDYVLVDYNDPHLTNEFGEKVIGDYAVLEDDLLTEILDELDGINPDDDDDDTDDTDDTDDDDTE